MAVPVRNARFLHVKFDGYETSTNCGKVLAKMLTHQRGRTTFVLLQAQIVSVVPKLAKTNKLSIKYTFLF